MKSQVMDIDRLIEVVSEGGAIKTGVDVFNSKNILLIEKDVLIRNVSILLTLKQNGIQFIPVDPKNQGGIWDKNGRKVLVKSVNTDSSGSEKKYTLTEVERKVKEINELKREASALHTKAKENIRNALDSIKQNDGVIEVDTVEESVTEVFTFLERNESSFTYLARELFTFDDYLYNHSVNVCTFGIAILKKFNEQFSQMVNQQLNNSMIENNITNSDTPNCYVHYQPDEMKEMALGFFLHDMGKVLLPEEILNKQGKLSEEEYSLVKTHSYEKGAIILKKSHIENYFVQNIIRYHHANLFQNEPNTYPQERVPIEIPPYVKICKLADIFDAMTSKRSYKEAINPVVVVTDIVRKYANKDPFLQLILHAFIKTVGVYPTGSIVQLQNGQLGYIIDSQGPIVLPFTDRHGTPMTAKSEPININDIKIKGTGLDIDRRKPLLNPAAYWDILPEYLKLQS